jgi:uncharacterized membrane protein (UPF0127 family)
VKVVHKKTNYILGDDIRWMNNFWGRLKGLMFAKEMIGDGLLIDPCNSIHNCFVRFPIDVIFLDSENKIVKIIRSFKPWRFSWIYFRAVKVIELPAGKIPVNISEGDEVEVLGV